MSSLMNFVVDLADLKRVGHDLQRPESVAASRDGTLWVSDSRKGLMRIEPDGTQTELGAFGGEPNGVVRDRAGNLYVAHISEGKVFKLYPDGRHEVLLSEIDGQPLGACSYVFLDSQERLWITSLSRRNNWFEAMNLHEETGFVALLEPGKPARIVADGLAMANEVRMDAREEYIYVAETMKCRMLRYRVESDGSLGPQEVFGPASLGDTAMVDGFALDAEGNVWVTTVIRNGLVVISADGQQTHTIFEDPNEAALDHARSKIAEGQLTPPEMFACVGPRVQFTTSVAFGGPDLKTVYLGSLAMPYLLSFESPVAGLPMGWQ